MALLKLPGTPPPRRPKPADPRQPCRSLRSRSHGAGAHTSHSVVRLCDWTATWVKAGACAQGWLRAGNAEAAPGPAPKNREACTCDPAAAWLSLRSSLPSTTRGSVLQTTGAGLQWPSPGVVQGRAQVPACVRGLGWPSRPLLGAKLSPKARLRWPSFLQSWPGATMLRQRWGDSVSASLGAGLGPSPAPAPHTVTQQHTTDKSQPRARRRAADGDHRKGVPSAGGLTPQAPPHRPPVPRGGLWEGHRTHRAPSLQAEGRGVPPSTATMEGPRCCWLHTLEAAPRLTTEWTPAGSACPQPGVLVPDQFPTSSGPSSPWEGGTRPRPAQAGHRPES